MENRRNSFTDTVLQGFVIAVIIYLIFYAVVNLGSFRLGFDNEEEVVYSESEFSSYLSSVERDILDEDEYLEDLEDGDETTYTLGELVNDRVVAEPDDSCDLTKSFVRIEKSGDDYTVETRLVCGERTDYLLTNLEIEDEDKDEDEDEDEDDDKSTIIIYKPAPDNDDDTTEVKYYEYYTEDSDKVLDYETTTTVKMCKYSPVVTKTDTFYALSYTMFNDDRFYDVDPADLADISSTYYLTNGSYGSKYDSIMDGYDGPSGTLNLLLEQKSEIGFVLPDGATNPVVTEADSSYSKFNISTYRSDKSNGYIYGTQTNTPLYINISNSFNAPAIFVNGDTNLGTNAELERDYSVSNGYTLEFGWFLYDRSVFERLANGTTDWDYDSKVKEDIIYVPVYFDVEYEIPSSSYKEDPCTELSDEEMDLVTSTYNKTTTDKTYKTTTTKTTSGWTTDPDNEDYIYTGDTKIVEE